MSNNGHHPIGDPLSVADLEQHRQLGIPADLLEIHGIRRVTDAQARELLGVTRSGDLSGVLYPGHHPVTGAVRNYRVRRDHPEQERGKPANKYIASVDRASLSFPLNCHESLTDPSVPIVFVEAEKSRLSIQAAAERCSRSVLPIATRGCWNWRGRIGKESAADGTRVDEKGPLADLDHILWRDRDVVIVSDANVAGNASVQAARRALTSELAGRGARVRITAVPLEDGLNGPDDYIGRHGDVAFFSLLDAAKPTATRREKPKAPKQGDALTLETPEPWPDPVNGAELLDKIRGTFRTYVVLPKHADIAIALWVLLTYVFDAFFVAPKLAITSPLKRCGKTQLLIVLSAVVPRALPVSNISASALFRTIQKFKPTLLIDEADTFMRDDDDLRGIVNAGHTRKTAIVIRTVGDDHEPRAFSCWCPQAIALIGRLSDTIADRSIVVRQQRRAPQETVTRLRQDRIDAECEPLRRQAMRWAADTLDQLPAADPDVPNSINDRAQDCWRALIAIAEAAGGHWPQFARDAARALSEADTESTELSVELLRDIRAILGSPEAQRDIVPSAWLRDQLLTLEARPWADFKDGRPISAKRIASLLAAHDIAPKSNGDRRGYRRDAFADAFTRYLSPEDAIDPSMRQNPNNDGPKPANSMCQDDPPTDTLKTAVSPMNTGLFDTLTDRKPDQARNEDGDYVF